MATLYFDDIEVETTYPCKPYTILYHEMLDFNKKWDPLPIHLSEEAAIKAGHKTIIGSGQYTLCVKQHFINNMPWQGAVIGSIGFDQLRFLYPLHAGDIISAQISCIEKRVSKSKPDRGVCKFAITLFNQDKIKVLSYTDIVMLKKGALESITQS